MKEDIIPERPELPENLKDTDAYIIMPNMGLIPNKLTMIPDPIKGGQRSKRFGAWLGLNILPGLDTQIASPDSPLILPAPPPVLLVADGLKDLRDRLIYEIDIMIDTAKDYMEGKIKINEHGVPVMVEPGPKLVGSEPDVPEGSVNVNVKPIGENKSDTAERQTADQTN